MADLDPYQPNNVPSFSKGEIAEFLISNSFPIFPLQTVGEGGLCGCGKVNCHSVGKHPLLRWNWRHIASSKRDFVEKWMAVDNVNYAAMTGFRSPETGKYLIVVDVDAKEHEILGRLPKTFTYRTGSGGWHFWFWSDYCFSNSVSRLAEKVDIRGGGGYVVIPPSRHKSGKNYEIQCLSPIADLPSFVIDKLSTPSSRAKASGVVKNLPSRKAKPDPSASLEVQAWTTYSLGKIRSMLSEGHKIPSGLRNNTVHRLLSSDRAKGSSLKELHANAVQYMAACDSANSQPSFSRKEVLSCISQVLKYRPYTTSPEDVNSAFYEFLGRSKTKSMSKEEYERMVQCDQMFFSSCIKLTSSPTSGWMTLQSISVARDEFMKECGFATHSRYPLPLLGKKLRGLGVNRHRTSKQNVWLATVTFPDKKAPENKGIYSFTSSQNCAIIEKEVQVESRLVDSQPTSPQREKASMPSTTAKRMNVSPVGNLAMTMKVQERTITVKVRKHPSEKRYCGRENQELGSAMLKLLAVLDDAEKKDFFASTLVVDEEGTAADFDAVQVGDQVGIALPFEEGWCSTIVKVDAVPAGADTISGTDMYTEDEVSFTFEEASIARAMGYFEILYREDPTAKGKYEPYGVQKEQQVKVAVYTPEEEEDPAAASGTPAQPGTATVGTTPAAVSPRFGVGPAPVPAPAASTPAVTPPAANTGTDEEVDKQMADDDMSVDALVANANTTDPEILKAILQAHNKPVVATGPAIPARRKTPEPSSEQEPDNGN